MLALRAPGSTIYMHVLRKFANNYLTGHQYALWNTANFIGKEQMPNLVSRALFACMTMTSSGI